MPVLKYRPNVGSPWQVVGITGQTIGMYPQIIVSALSGSTVTCSKGSTVLNAEEVSGTWTFTVTEYGEWTINIDEYITTIVDVDSVKVYKINGEPNLINYTMLYDQGNECNTITGGWSEKAQVSENTVSKNSDSYYIKSYDNDYAPYVYTNNTIKSSDYYCCDALSKITYYSSSTVYICFGAYDTNNFSGYQFTRDAQDFGRLTSAGNVFSRITNLADNKYYLFAVNTASDNVRVDVNLNCVVLLKQDDISYLSAYGETVDDILTNSNNLFTDASAIRYMIRNCTGDFMLSAIKSSTFLTALESSPYKEMIQANEHWAKFLAMVQ